MATTVNVTGASTTASTIRHIPSESKIVYVEYYDDSIYSELTNDSVYRGLIYYAVFLLLFAAVLIIILYGMRLHYRARLSEELERIRQEKEPGRVYYVEAGSGAQRIIPAPLSPPITDARMYNPIGEAVDDARRAAI